MYCLRPRRLQKRRGRAPTAWSGLTEIAPPSDPSECFGKSPAGSVPCSLARGSWRGPRRRNVKRRFAASAIGVCKVGEMFVRKRRGVFGRFIPVEEAETVISSEGKQVPSAKKLAPTAAVNAVASASARAAGTPPDKRRSDKVSSQILRVLDRCSCESWNPT